MEYRPNLQVNGFQTAKGLLDCRQLLICLNRPDVDTIAVLCVKESFEIIWKVWKS
jgi:hypothetical protein